jgi:hypothetical protein
MFHHSDPDFSAGVECAKLLEFFKLFQRGWGSEVSFSRKSRR